MAQAVEAELNAFFDARDGQTDLTGRRRLVLHGHLPECDVQTAIGAVPVMVWRVRDPAPVGAPLKLTSTNLPPYLRRAKSIEKLLPWLYLKGISTVDFSEDLTAELGPAAPGLPATTITWLTADWRDDHERWSKRDLSARRYAYFRAFGVCFMPRMDADRQCMLVIIRADDWGYKDVLGVFGGYRESIKSWCERLRDLKCRGLEAAPKLAVDYGAMGFWAALHKVYGKARVQICWVHKMANVLNAMPKSMQPMAMTQQLMLSAKEKWRKLDGQNRLPEIVRGI